MATILCIEDEVELRINIAEELEDAGYDVCHAGDGNMGLQMIIKHKPDLVLCDINMPRKNGFQVLKEIREQHQRIFARMPFIFLTALADKQRVLAGLKDGADAYLTKPIEFELLLATVEASLRQMDRVNRSQRSAHSRSLELRSPKTAMPHSIWPTMNRENHLTEGSENPPLTRTSTSTPVAREA